MHILRTLALTSLTAAALAACKPAPQEAATAAPAAQAPATTPEPAPTPVTETPAATQADLATFLAEHNGKYPHDGLNYLEQGPLAEQLKTLLGEHYAALLGNLKTTGPLTQDGTRFFITGNADNAGGSHAAAVVADPAQNALRVWLLTAGQAQEFASPEGITLEWPADVATTIENAAAPQ